MTRESVISAVIPAFNEAATIRDLTQRTLLQLSKVVVVDDGSTDATAEQIADLPIQLICHRENQGKATSLLHGVEAARRAGAECIVTLDGDGQHAPEEIQRLLSAHHEYPDCIIIGARLRNCEAAPRARRFANGFADFWISWAAGVRIKDSQSGFRVYPMKLLEDVNVPHNKGHGFVFESEILIEAVQAGFSCHSIPIESRYPRRARKSHFRPVADIAAIVLMVSKKLLAQNMNLSGLYRILVNKR
jgi:glycosyltransferase involved in cell wall biosynthesis